MLKGLPLAYDRDLQEDKEPVFDTVDQLLLVLPALAGMIATMTIDEERLARAAPEGFSLATDVAEWLVRQGVVFRDAHEIAGRLVQWCEARGCELWDASDADLASVDVRLTPEVRTVLTVRGALEARSARGGTAPARVAEQLARLADAATRTRPGPARRAALARRVTLPRSFFDRPGPDVAVALLGAVVVSDVPPDGWPYADRGGGLFRRDDAGSHAFRGRTPRNAVMFGPPGHVYVYFTYGMHWCMNLVCAGEGVASAVLLRAGEVVEGAAVATGRRATARTPRDLARGPARLTAALGVDGSCNGVDAVDGGSTLRVLAPTEHATGPIASGPRVGVGGAGAATPWRFWLADEPTVSVYRAHVPRRRRTE
jgi:DNA-3-methyladenine glycosylase